MTARLPAIAGYPKREAVDIVLVKNRGRGPHGAVMTGLAREHGSLRARVHGRRHV